MIYWDNNAVLHTAITEGEERGKAEGKAEEKIEIARNMKNEGFDQSTISKITGLSPEEIERLN